MWTSKGKGKGKRKEKICDDGSEVNAEWREVIWGQNCTVVKEIEAKLEGNLLSLLLQKTDETAKQFTLLVLFFYFALKNNFSHKFSKKEKRGMEREMHNYDIKEDSFRNLKKKTWETKVSRF